MIPLHREAWLNGLLGVIIFSGSLPATRLALRGFHPLFLTYSRAAIAGGAAAVALYVLRPKPPAKTELPGLVIVAAGVVVGFPLLSAIALQHITASRALLYIALLPISTATFAVIRGGERPSFLFWLFAGAASVLVMSYALGGGMASGTLFGDMAMFAAVILCGLGYAEGGVISRRLGGWQVISWALLISLPVMLTLALLNWPLSMRDVDTISFLALLYVSLFSMLIGFVFWYRGLAQGGIASIGQLQFAQPFLGLALAAGILGEPIGWGLPGIMAAVICCVAAARKFA